MLRCIFIAIFMAPVATHAAPRLNAFLFPDRSVAMLLIGALFYFGFKWRAR